MPSRFQKAQKVADIAFGHFIRRRDVMIIGRCFTCDAPITFETCETGHWILRRFMMMRYDERNAHAQCGECNRFKGGMEDEHEKRIRRLIGDEEVEKMLMMKNVERNFHAYELEELAKLYKEKERNIMKLYQ